MATTHKGSLACAQSSGGAVQARVKWLPEVAGRMDSWTRRRRPTGGGRERGSTGVLGCLGAWAGWLGVKELRMGKHHCKLLQLRSRGLVSLSLSVSLTHTLARKSELWMAGQGRAGCFRVAGPQRSVGKK